MVVDEKLLQSAQAKPKELYKVVIWGGIPTSSRKLAYFEEPAREKARVLSEMLYTSEFAAEQLLGLAESVEAIFPALPAFVVKLDGATLLDIERNPTKYPHIYRVEPVRIVRALLNVSAPMVGAPKAWELGYTGKKVNIAVVDTGVDAYYSLQNKVIAEKSFVEGEDTEDLCGHGTHVAGIAAGDEDVYRGIAPGAKLVSAKVLGGKDGSGPDYAVALGIVWATYMGAQVVNLSLGGKGKPQDLLCELCNLIADRGVVVAAAAGNEGEKGIESPGLAEKVITVGAVDKRGRVAPYSSRDVHGFGKPDVVAPGGLLRLVDGVEDYDQGIVSLRSRFSSLVPYPDEKHASLHGTSMATPHVSGAAAILIETLKENGFEGNFHYKIKKLLRNTAKDLGEPRNIQGSGLINLEKAIKASQATEPEEVGEAQVQSVLSELSKMLALETFRGVTYAVAQQLVSNLLRSQLSPTAEGDVMAEIHKVIGWLKSETEKLIDSYRRGLISYQEYQIRMAHLNAVTRQLYSLLIKMQS